MADSEVVDLVVPKEESSSITTAVEYVAVVKRASEPIDVMADNKQVSAIAKTEDGGIFAAANDDVIGTEGTSTPASPNPDVEVTEEEHVNIKDVAVIVEVESNIDDMDKSYAVGKEVATDEKSLGGMAAEIIPTAAKPEETMVIPTGNDDESLVEMGVETASKADDAEKATEEESSDDEKIVFAVLDEVVKNFAFNNDLNASAETENAAVDENASISDEQASQHFEAREAGKSEEVSNVEKSEKTEEATTSTEKGEKAEMATTTLAKPVSVVVGAKDKIAKDIAKCTDSKIVVAQKRKISEEGEDTAVSKKAD